MYSVASSYSVVAKTLHWLIALAIIFMLGLGWIMVRLPNEPDKFALFQLHKSIGITILWLSLLRLIWRLAHPAPPLPTAMPRWEQVAARATHILFYILIIVMPLTGWAIVSASPLNLPTVLYGVIPWPHLPILPTLENKRAISHAIGDVHGFLAYIIVGLLALHVGAALKHHFVDRDDVLTRMMPRFMRTLLNRGRGER